MISSSLRILSLAMYPKNSCPVLRLTAIFLLQCNSCEGREDVFCMDDRLEQLLGDTRKNITLNAGITGVLGYESINRGEALLYDGAKILTEDNFIYGAGGRLSFETYLSDRFVLILQGRTKVLWGTDLEQFRPSAGLGLRINF